MSETEMALTRLVCDTCRASIVVHDDVTPASVAEFLVDHEPCGDSRYTATNVIPIPRTP